MAESRLQPIYLLLVAALASAGTGMALTTDAALITVGVLAGALTLGHLATVPGRSGELWYLGVGVALATPILLRDVDGTAATLALGLLGAALVLELGTDAPKRRGFLISETAALAGYSAAFLGITSAVGFDRLGRYGELAAIGVALGAWFAIDSLARAVVGQDSERPALRSRVRVALSDWPVAMSVGATGALFALAWPEIRWWALPMVLMTYGFSHVAFVRYLGTRATYVQTIQALARIPEVAGLAPEGHAARTADLAVAVSRDLGMGPRDVNEVEYAALLHDIGRIALNEPAVLKAGYSDEDLAQWGSQIVGEAPYLRRVADYVEMQHQPYRRPGEELDEELPLASKVIKAVSAFDQAVAEAGLPPLEALELLHGGAAYDFDPRVVRSLRRVASARGIIAH